MQMDSLLCQWLIMKQVNIILITSLLVVLGQIVQSQPRYRDEAYTPSTYPRTYQPPTRFQQPSQVLDNRWTFQQPQASSSPITPRNFGNSMLLDQGSINGSPHINPATNNKITRHVYNGQQQFQQQQQTFQPNQNRHQQPMSSRLSNVSTSVISQQTNYCQDKLCYGLPAGCLEVASKADASPLDYACDLLVTSKRLIDPVNPVRRDILFELYGKTDATKYTYSAVGFSETGKMQGLVSACIHSDRKGNGLDAIKLHHSYNIPYKNVPAEIKSGIKELGVMIEDGTYQCRWIVQSSVEFNYDFEGTTISTQADLGYKNFHIQLAHGEYDSQAETIMHHDKRSSSKTPVSLAQTGTVKSFGSHILLRIHGSIMIVVWLGLVTVSIMLARYYKNEWINNKLSDLALWFVLHRFMMLAAWFCSMMSVLFAYMYTETYHPGYHSISGTICLTLSTIQIFSGLLRPSQDSSKRVYFNWIHFICGNLSYLLAIFCLVTASFLPSIQLPPVYIWVVALFVAFYALIHFIMTIHQFIVHKSSKISITPLGDLNSQTSSYADACGFVTDVYTKEANGLKQCMIGVLITVVVIFIIVLVSLVNFN